MPGKVKVKILSGRNLPVMDRSSDTTDAYVEIKLGNTTYKTDVCRKSLNPQWNSEWYRFEVDDSELQDEPLQIRLMDHDTYSANDAIGKVYLDLNPLLLPTAPAPVRSLWSTDTTSGSCCNSSGSGGSFMSGWIPVYDTMHGIRGEVNIMVKVELFSDFNKFRQSSCGVHFFCSPTVPQGYHAQIIHGFVEELVVNDDPEYQWIDKIRTPRASNEARQTLFFKLSGEIQRKIGLKALDLGGNAVIGYCQNFDLEGESGIVARGIGTAVTLIKIQDNAYHMDSNFVNDRYSLDAATGKSMLYSLNANSTNVVPPKSPRIHASNYGMKNIPYMTEEKDHPVMGSRFPGLDKPKLKTKKGKVTVVYQEGRSRSVDRGKGLESYLKRGRSTQSLVMNPKEEQSDIYSIKSMQRRNINKLSRGLRAIRMLPKSILMKKTSKYRGKLNSDSSSVQGDESEVDSLSDWPVKEVEECKKSCKYRAQNDSSHYGLDRVLEVKETTISPPGTPTQQGKETERLCTLRGENFVDNEKNESSESTSSDSSSSEDTSQDSSPRNSNSLSTMKSFSFRKKSLKMNLMFKTKKHFKNTQSEESDASPKKYPPEEKKRKNRGKKNKSPIALICNPTNEPKVHGVESCSVEHDVACPKINVVSYYQDEAAAAAAMAMSACSHASLNNISNNNPCCLMSPLHKSKSATALDSYPSHECERALSSVLIAPDYKEHGPCLIPPSRNDVEVDRIVTGTASVASSQPANPQIAMVARSSQSPGKITTVPCMHRRSSDSDLSITPKGNSLTGSDRSSGMRDVHARQPYFLVRPCINQEALEMLEYPFLTMSKYPPGFIQHLGGTVSARSVKLLERITNLEEPETRDAWWTELRMEVRSHTRAMGCNIVIGYSENTSICDDVCVLSASGTAALLNLNASDNDVFSPQHLAMRTVSVQPQSRDLTASLDRCDFEKDGKSYKLGDIPQTSAANPSSRIRHQMDSNLDGVDLSCCTICHIPYSESSVPFSVNMQKCAICRRGKVPDVLFTTIDLIDSIPTVGKGSFIHAYVCRPKRDCKGEMNAKEISDGLPFLEYELHRLLINKLKVRGMNTIFGLKVQVSIGEKMLIGLATGTATFLAALPTPPVPKVSAGNSWKDSKKFSEMQRQLQETVKRNRDFYHLKSFQESDFHLNGRHATDDTDESDDDLAELDLSLGNKDTCILEVDDAEDADVVSLLIDPMPPDGFHVVNTETVPGLDEFEIVKNLQMFTQVWRAKIPLGQPLSAFNQHFNRLLQSVYYKLRNMAPCALNDLRFKITLEQDEIQLSLLGMALGLGESDLRKRTTKNRLIPSLSKETVKKIDDSDLIFSLEEDAVTQNKARNRSPLRSKIFKHMPPRSRYGVDITPLSYVPGGKIEKYLGNLNFFFIRESTCIREGGGLSGFIHSFITEVLAIVRAHVTALGGNAMVAYFMTECFLYHYPHKNQGQCLINVGGDVVYISYFPDDQ